MHTLKRLYLKLHHPHNALVIGTTLQFLLILVICTGQAFAVIRFSDRSLFMYNAQPSANTKYVFALTYTTQTAIGSLDLLFCDDPIPTDPCHPPAGLNVSGAVLADQTGEGGYHISVHTSNHIVLSRPPGVVGNTPSTYTFTNMINPHDTTQSFAVRLSDYTSSDATGELVDLGSVLSESSAGVTIETQVPPILTFCAAKQVNDDCSDVSDENYTDAGQLATNHTLTATSQMAAGTNASSGYVITVNGPTMSAGTNVIDGLQVPSLSTPGNTQFGINLRANSFPNVGNNPDGDWANAQPTSNYNLPNRFMYKDGDVVASAPHVSLSRRFTISYIVNAAQNLRAGVYTTTLTYICSGRF